MEDIATKEAIPVKAGAALKKNLYRWHRLIGLATIIPVIFWALSGLMHPFMAHWFKPQIAREFMKAEPLRAAQMPLSLQEVLQQNSIERFRGSRIVAFSGTTFYQIKDENGNLHYFDANSGQALPDGDKLYATWLARFFLDDQKSAVKDLSLQTEFSQEYKYVNRLLPVWKVSFERDDSMDLYVETASSRLGTFNPTSRKAFLWIFDNFHNWTWATSIANDALRRAVMSLFLGIIILSTASGLLIYGFWWKRFAKPKKRGLMQYHRQVGLAVSFVALGFAGSGLYHALHKPEADLLSKMVYEPVLKASDLSFPSNQAIEEWERVSNLSVVQLGSNPYFQVFYTRTEEKPAEVRYIHAKNGKALDNGNIVYAKFLANKFAAFVTTPTSEIGCCSIASSEQEVLSDETLKHTAVLTKFESREYGFVFKRLPVVQLAYEMPNGDAFYIETATSRLAAHIQHGDRREGYSFAIFHKYLLMDWAGKDVRDVVTMLSALGVLSVSLLGLAIWLKRP